MQLFSGFVCFKLFNAVLYLVIEVIYCGMLCCHCRWDK